jgi:O-antigen ligase
LGAILTDRIPKFVIVAGAAFVPLVLALIAYSRPGYFSMRYLAGLLLIEFLFAALWMYRKVFFPLLLCAFLFAGLNLPLGSFWTAGRWIFLGVGAMAGTVIILKDRNHRIGGFHVLAFFAVLAALVSAAVCRYTWFSLLKVLSLFLLFLYAATGARLAAAGRESRFFTGLLTGCELFVAAMALFYFGGIEAMGNPNSLGAVMGVVGVPILLWGALLDESPSVHYRRLLLCGIALYMAYHSQSRAGIAAAFLSCGLLCLALRRYKLLAQGMCIIVILIAASAIIRPQAVPSFVDAMAYKGKDPSLGLLASRETPWQGAVESIRKHFWFGSGFGITDNGEDASAHLGSFRTDEGASRENGSSYLTIVTWVGMAGVLPFLLLLMALLGKIMRTLFWMLNTENPCHPAVPLAIVTFSGLVHSGFEDWLFAPGYYLCIFFWSVAFILVDFAPQAPLPSFSAPWRPRLARTAGSFVASQ